MSEKDDEILRNYRGPNPKAYSHRHPVQDALNFVAMACLVFIAAFVLVWGVQAFGGLANVFMFFIGAK